MLGAHLATPEGPLTEWMQWGWRVRASLNGQRERDGEYNALTDAQARTMEAIAQTIIPETDTPGAGDAQVTEFVTALVDGWLDPEEIERFLGGLDAVDGSARQRFGAPFAECDAQAQVDLVGELDEELGAWRDDPSRDAQEHFFHDIKRFSLTAYFTSEAGLGALGHRISFRSFRGCVPVEPIGGPG